MWSQGHLLAPVVTIFLLLLEGFTATYAALVSTAVVMYAWLLGRWVWPLLGVGILMWVTNVGPWWWVALAVIGLLGAIAKPGGAGRVRTLAVSDGPAALISAPQVSAAACLSVPGPGAPTTLHRCPSV